ncbi:hypothetical protein AALP_AAs42893U000900 [Arabis alpina]|uniref:Uncharacterized protein n=1 Tax=Arabis alpina TaxID=50452 RepID=A0A087FX84_ARAAL|nr:hypothetical protein AALP_AAs42893U000900 [Arabis alpina]
MSTTFFATGPMSRGDDAEGTASGTRCPEFDPTYTRLDLDGTTSLLLTNETDEVVTSGTEVTSADVTMKLTGTRDKSDDEDTFIEVEQTRKAKKVKKKPKVKVRPDPHGSSLSDEKSLKRLRKKCGISEEIVTEHLSYLMDFRVHGRSEELKHTVTNSSGMALISVKPSLHEVSEDFVAAMHTELSSGNGNWRKSFSRRRIERALSAEIFPGKILGRGLARMSFREQAALEVAAKAKRYSGSSTPRVVEPMSSTPTAPSARARPSRPSASKSLLPPPSSGELAEFRRQSAERARISNGKGKGVDLETPLKRQRVDTFPAAVVGRETSASRLSLFFDRLVSDYDEDVCSRDSELGAAKEANAVLQLRLDETVERNEVREPDAIALQKVKKDYDDKLAKLKLRCSKAEGEVVQLRGELSSTSDVQRSRIDDAVAEAKDEMTRSFAERTSKVVGLLAEIGGKAQNDMLNLTEIDANLEFIGLLQGSEPPDLLMEVKALRGRRHSIYDAHDVFADLLASVQRVLKIPVVSAGAAEASVVVDDDIEVSDEDDVEVIDDDEDDKD